MPIPEIRADVFCRRIDNYGDVGVCWRLARALRQAGGWRVRLWIDDLPAFARMEPRCDPLLDMQEVRGIDIVAWSAQPPVLPPGDVVIEAFACDPPDSFRAAMRRHPPIWINLEYLSAESWVESHHRLPSPQPDGLMKYFFFPGFTPGTGGLLREPDLTARRDAFMHEPGARLAFLRELGLPGEHLARLATPTGGGTGSAETDGAAGAADQGTRLVTLFCYPDAPLAGLLEGLRADSRPTLLLVPEGVAPRLELAAGAATPGLRMARIPFLPQDDYDRLLWCADLNFVRGEDSVVRAGWAGRPLVWQIYPQADDAHLAKLDAWLERYGPPAQASALFRAWNRGADARAMAQAWREATAGPAWADWQATARAWDADLSRLPDLATNLISFCAQLRAR